MAVALAGGCSAGVGVVGLVAAIPVGGSWVMSMTADGVVAVGPAAAGASQPTITALSTTSARDSPLVVDPGLGMGRIVAAETCRGLAMGRRGPERVPGISQIPPSAAHHPRSTAISCLISTESLDRTARDVCARPNGRYWSLSVTPALASQGAMPASHRFRPERPSWHQFERFRCHAGIRRARIAPGCGVRPESVACAAYGTTPRRILAAMGDNVRGDGPGLLRAIAARLPDLRLLTDPADRESYRRDETAYLAAGLPLAVALPDGDRRGRRARPAVRRARRADRARAARARGLSGGAAGIEGALTIAFTRMDRILEIDRENLTVTTQPGIVNADLKAAVAAEGLFYAPDPGVVRDVHDRRQPRHERRRAVLREVRRDPRCRARPRGRDGRRHAPPARRQERQGRRRLRADPAARRQPGHARAHDRGDPPPPSRAAAARDDAGVLPVARGGRRGGGRAHRGRPRAR